MANLKEIRIRIASVISTRQITKCHENGVRLPNCAKAQDAILQIRPYAGKLHDILMSLVDSLAAGEGNEYAQGKGILTGFYSWLLLPTKAFAEPLIPM